MIAVLRKATPQSLVDNAAAWTADYLAARAALVADPKSIPLKKLKDKAENKYRQTDVKEALQGMFHDKCCFCERKRDYPHIEHFNPKDSAPELCFDWLNLLYACEVCNGATFKGTKFPLAADGTPLFINPCTDNPDDHLDFVCEQDAAAEHGFIAILKGKTDKGNTTKDVLGLNRINLLKERNHHIAPYYLKLAIMAREGDQTAKDLLDRACQSHNIFAAFMRGLRATIVGV
jgi:uncharacterized protein (TIGR02646 family)